MKMPEREVFAVSKNHEFTEDEYDDLFDKVMMAKKSGNEAEFKHLVKQLPIAPKVLRAFAEVYGREYILSMGYDMTQANMEFGEGWFDEIQ